MSRLWALAILALFAALVVACDDENEDVPAGSPTTPASTSATIKPSSTAPVLSPTPVTTAPADWATYVDELGRYTLRYPSGWFKGQFDDFYSFDPRQTSDGPNLPPESIKVEVNYSTALGSDVCGAVLKTDPETGEALGLLPGAQPTRLGGIDGGWIIREKGDPAIEGNLTRIEGIGVVNNTRCVLLTAYYTQQQPDTNPFSAVAASFTFQEP